MSAMARRAARSRAVGRVVAHKRGRGTSECDRLAASVTRRPINARLRAPMRSKTGTRRGQRRRGAKPPTDHAKAILPNPFAALLTTVQRDVDRRLKAFL